MADQPVENQNFIVKIDIEQFNEALRNQILEENLSRLSKENKFAYLDKDLHNMKQQLGQIQAVEKSGPKLLSNNLNSELESIKNTIDKNKSYDNSESVTNTKPNKPSQGRG